MDVPPPSVETLLPFPASIHPLRAARSTILVGSIAVIRESGRFDAYRALLPKEFHGALFEAIAGTWTPAEAAVAHYKTCDLLDFSPEEQVANGRRTFDRTGAVFFGTMMRMAKGAGVTPWTFLPHLQRFYERGYDGGGVAVFRAGPKESQIVLVESGICESRYYRAALRGLLGAMVEMFCSKAYLVELRPPRGPSSMSVRVQWA